MSTNIMILKSVPFVFSIFSLAILGGCSNPITDKQEVREPEAATGFNIKNKVIANDFMIAAANPYAVKAGQAILENGGSAVDAAIATQLVLTLVEPQSSGIGGGAFLLHYDKSLQTLKTYDGRETAPSNVSPSLFLDDNGKAVSWIKAVVGGRSVGVPGILHMLDKAYKDHGTLPWAELFQPAIKLAEQGFIVSPRLNMLLSKKFNPGLTQLKEAKSYFYPDDQPLAVGSLRKNPKLAELYKNIAKHGISAFYSGKHAQNMIDAVQSSAIAPGTLSLSDLESYQSKYRDAICVNYHKHKVCSMAPPSSGGIAVLQTLKLLEEKELRQYKPNDPFALHLFTQASRLAFADRNYYVADPDFVNVPTKALLNENYLFERAKLITGKDNPNVPIGVPSKNDLSLAEDNSYELPSTTHISIVDKHGDAVSMTSSIEMGFGSTVMVDGYLLNNQLTDFALTPKKNGKWRANRVEANKRPRSSMSPVMVFNADGSLRLVLGSPGGSRIINYVTQTVIGVLDWGLDIQTAINLPKITNRNKVTTLERGTELAQHRSYFESLGHKVVVRDLNSGLHGIELVGGRLVGGADPRREGIVLGE